MSVEKLARVVFDGPGRITWYPLEAAASSAAAILTPSAAVLSAGLGAVSAGASLYNVFQLREQRRMLLDLDRRLAGLHGDILNIGNQLQELEAKAEHLLRITERVDMNVELVKDLALLTSFIAQPLQHFADRVAADQTFDLKQQAAVLAADFAVAYEDLAVRQLRRSNDARITASVADKFTPVIFLLHNMNMFVLDAHNASAPDAGHVTPYYRLEEGAVPADCRLHELRRHWHLASGLSEDGKKTKGEPRPRMQWLVSLMWELEHVAYTFQHTKLQSTATRELGVPHPDVIRFRRPAHVAAQTSSG